MAVSKSPESVEDASRAVLTARASRRALVLLEAGKALVRARIAMGPFPTPEFKEALVSIPDPPLMRVRCNGRGCAYRLAKWELVAERGAVRPYRRPSKATTPGWESVAWIDAANNRKGNVMTAANEAHDGLATLNHHCPKCGRNVPVSAERRLKLFLEALLAERREIWI